MRSLALAALALAAAAPSADAQGWRPAREVEVQLSRYVISPSELRMSAGAATRLRIVNSNRTKVTLRAPEFFAAARVRPRDAAAVVDGKIAVEAGRTREIVLIPAAGNYPIASDRFLPRLIGMRGEIVVE